MCFSLHYTNYDETHATQKLPATAARERGRERHQSLQPRIALSTKRKRVGRVQMSTSHVKSSVCGAPSPSSSAVAWPGPSASLCDAGETTARAFALPPCLSRSLEPVYVGCRKHACFPCCVCLRSKCEA